MKGQKIIFALVGKSKAGKTTLIIEALKALRELSIIKCVTTRAKRDQADDVSYDFLSVEEFKNKIIAGDLIEYVEYAGNYYGITRSAINCVLVKGYGICSVVEHGVTALKESGFNVLPIKIISAGGTETTIGARKDADITRENIEMNFSAVIVNSFADGGKKKATDELVAFLKSNGVN